MDQTIPSKAVKVAAILLALCVALGIYQGLRRTSEQAQVTGDLGAVGAPVPGARMAAPLAEAAPSLLTEAQVREIARQEARTALGRPATSAPVASEEGEAPAAGAARSAPLAPAAPPLPTPSAPAAEPPASDAPLF
jgi:hypothetical protein